MSQTTRKRKRTGDASASTSAPPAMTAATMVGSNFYLVSEILGHVCPSTYPSCQSVSWTFHTAALPYVYRHVQLDGDTRFTPIRRSARLGLPGPPGQVIPLGLLQRYTRSLEVSPETHHGCVPTRGRLVLPRLRTLVTQYNCFRHHPFYTDESYGGVWSGLEPCDNCAHWKLSPRRCVVRPCLECEGALECNLHLPEIAVDELVLHVHRHTAFRIDKADLDAYRAAAQPTGDTARPRRRRLTLVILPYFWDTEQTRYAYRRERVWLSNAPLTSFAHQLQFNVLALLLTVPDLDIRVVGIEDANPWAPQRHWDDRHARPKRYQDLLRSTMRTTSGARFFHPEYYMEPDDIDDRLEHLSFQTLYDYLDSGAWGGEFYPSEVGRWLNAYDQREAEGKGTDPLAWGGREWVESGGPDVEGWLLVQ